MKSNQLKTTVDKQTRYIIIHFEKTGVQTVNNLIHNKNLKNNSPSDY